MIRVRTDFERSLPRARTQQLAERLLIAPLLRGSCADGKPQLRGGVSYHDPRPLQRQRGHDRGDDDIWPTCTRSKYAQGRDQNREVANDVVARANPS